MPRKRNSNITAHCRVEAEASITRANPDANWAWVIQRIHLHAVDEERVRFAVEKNGRMLPFPGEFLEDDLPELLAAAAANHVLDRATVQDLWEQLGRELQRMSTGPRP